MDYSNVNNPFITLRNENTEQEFTADLSRLPPSVDNDPTLSNLKKSNHALYSDNRATKMRQDGDIKALGNYSLGLMDVDNIIYEYFTKVIQPQVMDTDSGIIAVPVRHASPERWSAIQSDGVYRDDKGQVQRPIIIFTRTSVSRDESFVHFNKYLTVPFVKQYSSKNAYDRFSLLHSPSPLMEVHNVTFPSHVVLNYDFTMATEYVQQMNQLVEIINFAEGDYWGDPKRFKFRATIDSFSTGVETPSDEDRAVNTTFSLNVNAYLLPEVFNDKTTTQRSLTTRKVVWGTEAEATGSNFLPEKNTIYNSDPKRHPADNVRSFSLHRKSPSFHITHDFKFYELSFWKDIETYSVYVGDREFKIEFEDGETDDKKLVIWDVGQTELELKCGDVQIIDLSDTEKLRIEVDTKLTSLIRFEYIG